MLHAERVLMWTVRRIRKKDATTEMPPVNNADWAIIHISGAEKTGINAINVMADNVTDNRLPPQQSIAPVGG